MEPARIAAASETPAVTEPVIHVHEDDWGMRNLYPAAARAEVAKDMSDAVALAEKYRDPSGFGWSELHMIQAPSMNYVDAGLRIADAAAAIEPIMPRVRRFYASIGGMIGRVERDPFGSYEEDAWSFGFGRHCYLKLDLEGEHVKYIWFDFDRVSAEEESALRASLKAIDQLVPSFIADYFMHAEVPLRDDELLGRYLAQRRAQCDQIDTQLRERRAP